MVSRVSIANAALAEIGADSIASLDEPSKSATECARVFDAVLEELLDRSDWGFRVRRVTPAALANDRPAEWNCAYAKPAEASRVLRVLEPGAAVGWPEWGVYSTPLWDSWGPIPFVEIAGVIYTNVAHAVLEIAVSNVALGLLPRLFRRAVELEIAARVAMPIKKDRAVKSDMIQQAELALARAVAEDRNRAPRTGQRFVGEVELARDGCV